MILADTSIWINHFRRADPNLVRRLNENRIVCHPFVIGELALGQIPDRLDVLSLLAELPQSEIAQHVEVMHFIDINQLFGRGIGFVDAHLLAAVRLSPGMSIWTADKRLESVAQTMGLNAEAENGLPPAKP